MIRLAVFSERFWPEGGGGELATYLILKILASSGKFEVNAYTGSNNVAPLPNARIYSVDWLRASNKLELFWKIQRSKDAARRILERADIIYIPRFAYPLIPLAKKLGRNVIVHLHDYQPISYTSVILAGEDQSPIPDYKRTFILELKDKGFLKALASTSASPITRLMRKWVALADKIICVSRRQEQILLKFAPEYRNKTVVIYNPLPELPHIRKTPAMTPTFLYPGGSSYIKGFHVFMEASLKALRQNRKIKFVMTNNYKPQHLMLIKKLNKQYNNAYEVMGRVSHNELIELQRYVWGLILPSIWEEPLPYSVIEAALLGTIPIASNVGAIPEILGESVAKSFLVKPYDVDELAEKILGLNASELDDIALKLKSYILKRLNPEGIRGSVLNVFNFSG